MPRVSPRIPCVQACYNHVGGIILRIDGKSRPASLDEIEQDYSQAQLDEVLSSPGRWVSLMPRPNPAYPSTCTCRCWAAYRGDTVTIILPNVGKVVVPVETVASHRERGDRRLLDIFNCVLEADNLARRDAWKGAKAHVELSDEEVGMVEAVAARSFPRLAGSSSVRPAAMNPHTRPAA